MTRRAPGFASRCGSSSIKRGRHTFASLARSCSYKTFVQVVAEVENAKGHDLEGIYRDPRGTIYHPHLRKDIPIGTLSVESYDYPSWTFRNVLYLEKAGYAPVLKDVEWPKETTARSYQPKGSRRGLRATCSTSSAARASR